MGIKEVLKTFNDMEAGGLFVRYAIGGAVGALFYLEPIDTEDVDIFICFRPSSDRLLIDLSPIHKYLVEKGGILENEYVRLFGWPIQISAASEGLVQEALDEARETEVEGVFTRAFSAEHLAVLALQTGRAKDKARLLQFLEAKAIEQKRFHDIIDRHGLKKTWEKFEKQFLTERP
jgi:hypothetical protein